MKIILTACLLFQLTISSAQTYTSASIFSHNDYAGANPFNGAYDLHVGYIEADVFVRGDKLLIGHSRSELDLSRTLEKMYILPLQQKITAHHGQVYTDKTDTLVLMIDLKTAGKETLSVFVELLKKYPLVRQCTTLRIAISGNVPDRQRWQDYPSYIYFDGRPGRNYSSEELKRIAFISTDFHLFSSWNGDSPLSKNDKQKLQEVMNEAHSVGKKMRFWATPDGVRAWAALMQFGVDILNTDDVKGLATYLQKAK